MIGACIFMTANETCDLMWMGSPNAYKTIAKLIGQSIYAMALIIIYGKIFTLSLPKLRFQSDLSVIWLLAIKVTAHS